MPTATQPEVIVMVHVVAEDGHEPTQDELSVAAEYIMRELVGEIAGYVAALERDQLRRAARFRSAAEPSRN
jgi:hypothetical protein